MKIYNFLSLLIILLTCSVGGGCISSLESAAEPVVNRQPAEPVKNDPAAKWRNLDLKLYPDADTILLDDVEKTSYNPDGTYESRDEYYVMICNENGRRDMRTLIFNFSSFYNLEPEVAVELIKPDGRVVVPALQRSVTVESSQMEVNIYDPSHKVLSIGIPDLEIGDIVHVTARRQEVRPHMQGVWCDISILQLDSAPVLHYVYEISAPAELPLLKIAVKDEVPGTLTRTQFKDENGRLIYRFEVNNVPQMISEPDMPPFYMHAMRVLVSTAGSWEEISRWYYELCNKRIQARSPELIAHAKKLAEGKSREEALRSIFDFVSKEIRYTGVTTEENAPGYEPHDVSQTFAQRHGVCRDKAALLAAMLQVAGFDAFTVLFMAGDPKDPEVPNNYFNHAITGVRMPDGELILMDSTDENTSDLLPAYSMNRSFLCATAKGDTLQRTPVIAPEKNMTIIRSQGSIDSNHTLTLKSEITFCGFNDNIYRSAFAGWTDDYRQQFIASVMKRTLPGAEVINVQFYPEDVRDLSKELKVIVEFQVDNFVDIEWGAGALRMPFLSNGFGALALMLSPDMLPERKYPMEFSSTVGVDEECVLELPDSLEVAAFPEYNNIDNATMLVECAVSSSGRQITGKKVIKLRDVEITAAEYADFRKAVQEIFISAYRKVIVKRDFADAQDLFAGAQAVMENSDIKLTYTSQNSYILDCRQKLRILNYGGVKAYSELTIPFTDKIACGRFISGTVTAPDGSIVEVDHSTIQLMDAPGSEASPRYPAGKRLIVPLPNVKVGSVIEYHWQLEVKDMPFNYSFFALWNRQPTITSSVTVDYPKSMAKLIKISLPEAGFDITHSEEGKRKIVRLRGENIPRRVEEPGVPEAWLFVPGVGVTMFDQVKYSAAVQKAIIKASENNPQSTALALEITAKAESLRDKVIIIRDYVARNIRAAGSELDELGVKYISKADTTLQDGYGNSVDRAVLLYTMLKAVGVENLNLYLASGLPYNNEVLEKYSDFMHNCFDSVLLGVEFDDEEIYLNDTDEYAELGSSSHEVKIGLDLKNGELINIMPIVSGSTCMRGEWSIKCLDDGSAQLTYKAVFWGMEYASLKRFFCLVTPEKEQQFWQTFAAGQMPGAVLLERSHDFNGYPGEITISIKVPEFWSQSGDYISLTLPESGNEDIFTTAGSRTQPYWFLKHVNRTVSYELEIPAQWSVCEMAGGKFDEKLPGAGGSVAWKSLFMPEESLFIVSSFVFIEPFYIDSSSYSYLVALQKVLANPANRTILFKTTGK